MTERLDDSPAPLVPDDHLVEVAITLPLRQTFTYRDRRGRTPLPLGSQVVVPFGSRVVTGFVVGHPQAAPGVVKDVLDVVDDDSLLEPEVLSLCRWAASYYLSPLGEVLKTALPQGQRAAARRGVRLSDEGERLAAAVFGAADRNTGGLGLALLALDEGDRALLLRLKKAGSLGVRPLERDRKVGAARVERLVREGFLEVGDEVSERQRGPMVKWAFGVGDVTVAQQRLLRAHTQLTLWRKLHEAGVAGVMVDALTPPERTALRALMSRALARVENRAVQLQGDVAVTPDVAPPLNEPQQAAFDALTAALGKTFAPFLLQGITGSGKTEVYLRVIAEARKAGRGALVLVPEIALTPQLAARFRARFGDDVAVLHSALPATERLRAWRRLKAGQVGIALGARSAVFAPVQRLGVVVIDEEHDPSFKQDEGVRYHGRDLALVRARQAEAVAIMGSATPSLESYFNVQQGKYTNLRLPVRAAPGAATRPLPKVDIIDLRRFRVGNDGLLSKPLADAIEATVAAGEQVILFLNRRGFATVVLCRACGHVIRCPDCDVSMTFHLGQRKVVCHYCGRNQTQPERCPECHKPALEQLGIGTERVEAVVRERFAGARVARLDRDTAGPTVKPRRGSEGAAAPNRGLEAILAKVHAREIDILVGTQMVTKGHDFPGVTLVGVLQPDQGMHLPDFRAAERTFQLLEQVAGRAGRAEKAGRVLVQTYNPKHPAIVSLTTHDYDGFAAQELEHRRGTAFPPFLRLVAVRLDAPDAALVQKIATDVAERARAAGGPTLRILGPAEAPIPRLRGRVRWQVWLSSPNRAELVAAAEAAAGTPLGPDVRLAVDVDPQSVL